MEIRISVSVIPAGRAPARRFGSDLHRVSPLTPAGEAGTASSGVAVEGLDLVGDDAAGPREEGEQPPLALQRAGGEVVARVGIVRRAGTMGSRYGTPSPASRRIEQVAPLGQPEVVEGRAHAERRRARVDRGRHHRAVGVEQDVHRPGGRIDRQPRPLRHVRSCAEARVGFQVVRSITTFEGSRVSRAPGTTTGRRVMV